MSYGRIYDVKDRGDGTLRVHGQFRRDTFHFDGRLKKLGDEYASEWLWYPTKNAYQQLLSRIAEVDQMEPTEKNLK